MSHLMLYEGRTSSGVDQQVIDEGLNMLRRNAGAGKTGNIFSAVVTPLEGVPVREEAVLEI